MNPRPLSLIIAALCLAAGPLLCAQTDVPPPKALPVPENAPGDDPEEAPEAAPSTESVPAAPPKAKPVEEEDPPPDEPPPDEAWEPEEARKARLAEEAKLKDEQRKAKEEMERQERESEKMEKDEVKKARAVPNEELAPLPVVPREPRVEKPRIPIAKDTDPNAKPLSLRVPAPRGLIVDRRGQPLAQNKIAHFIGIQLPMQEGLTDVQILDCVRPPLAFCQTQISEKWELSDADIISHYKKRRWVPIYSSALVPEERVEKLKDSLPPYVVLRPIFLRAYPNNALAGHLIGHMGKNENGFFAAHKLDLQSDELMWPPTAGRQGLEKRFDKELTGEPGTYSALFDSRGEKLAEESTPPRAGHTVVTSLDIEMQRIAERKLLEEGCAAPLSSWM